MNRMEVPGRRAAEHPQEYAAAVSGKALGNGPPRAAAPTVVYR